MPLRNALAAAVSEDRNKCGTKAMLKFKSFKEMNKVFVSVFPEDFRLLYQLLMQRKLHQEQN